MNTNKLYKLCAQFAKQAGIIYMPASTSREIGMWIMQEYNNWLNHDVTFNVTFQEKFTLDTSQFPVNYGIPLDENTEIVIQVNFTLAKKPNIDAKFYWYGLQGKMSESFEDRVPAIVVNIKSPKKLSENLLQAVLVKIRMVIDHELRHLTQFLIAQYSNGFENVDIEKKTRQQQKFKDTSQIQSHPLDQNWQSYHPLRDIELQTLIGDNVTDFLYRMPDDWTNDDINAWVGNPSINEKTSEFFSTLKEYDYNKWKYAVKEFYKSVKDRTEKYLARQKNND